MRNSRNWVFRFRSQLAPNENDHQDGNKRDREEGREAHSQGLCPGQRTEHASFLRFQQENRQERDHNNKEGEEQCGPDLFGGVDKSADPLSFRSLLQVLSCGCIFLLIEDWPVREIPVFLGYESICLPFGKLPVSVFNHHNRRVYQYADGQRDSAQRHDVGAHIQVIHGNERDRQSDRQRENRDQC